MVTVVKDDMAFPTLPLVPSVRARYTVAALDVLMAAGSVVVATRPPEADTTSAPTTVLEVRSAGGFAPQFTDFRAPATVLVTSDRRSLDWPVDAGPITAASGCVVVRAPSVVKLLSSARANALFRSAGKTWEVFARPMLPGDSGCQ